MARHDPVSHHNGSVWSHDTALCVAGLARYGHTAQARRAVRGVLDAAVAFGGRLPELFCGFDRTAFPHPVPYPTSCSPQAWAAAAPLLLIRAILGFDPDLPRGRLYFDPPPGLDGIALRNLPAAGRRIDVIGAGEGEIHGLPDIEIAHRRHPA